MVSSIVFHVLPTALEISMVSGILVSYKDIKRKARQTHCY